MLLCDVGALCFMPMMLHLLQSSPMIQELIGIGTHGKGAVHLPLCACW